MSEQLHEVKPRPEPPRDRYGRYLIVPAAGGKARAYTRATTFASTIDDRHNLEQWMVRTTALGLVARQDLYARVASTPPEHRAVLNKLCEEAREAAKASSGANLGTALHAFTERVDLGQEVTIPHPWDADVAAYRLALQQAGISVDPTYVEGIVVLPEFEVAGTFDRLVRWQGRLCVADLKTGADLSWSWNSIAVQLALYANATTMYDPEHSSHVPMPAVQRDHAIVMHLPVGRAECQLHLVDIAAGWEAAQHCAYVRAWRTARTTLATPLPTIAAVEPNPHAAPAAPGGGGPDAPPPPIHTAAERLATMRANLVERIERLRSSGHIETLRARWPGPVPTFKQAIGHTEEQMAAIEQAVTASEAEHEVPFAAMDVAEMVPAHMLENLRAAIEQLPERSRAALDRITTEAAAANHNLSMRRQAPTMARYVRAVAAVELAATFDGEEDVCRAALSLVLGEGVQPDQRVGAVVGGLAQDQAERVVALCRANRHTDGGLILGFDPQQHPHFIGDLTPYQP